MRDLFRGYNKLIRPVQNMTQTVDVRFGLAFVQLINVVRIEHKFTFNKWCLHNNISLLLERKKSNYEIECLVAIGLE